MVWSHTSYTDRVLGLGFPVPGWFEAPSGELRDIVGVEPGLDQFLVEAGPGGLHRRVVVVVGKDGGVLGEGRPVDPVGVLFQEVHRRRIHREVKPVDLVEVLLQEADGRRVLGHIPPLETVGVLFEEVAGRRVGSEPFPVHQVEVPLEIGNRRRVGREEPPVDEMGVCFQVGHRLGGGVTGERRPVDLVEMPEEEVDGGGVLAQAGPVDTVRVLLYQVHGLGVQAQGLPADPVQMGFDDPDGGRVLGEQGPVDTVGVLFQVGDGVGVQGQVTHTELDPFGVGGGELVFDPVEQGGHDEGDGRWCGGGMGGRETIQNQFFI